MREEFKPAIEALQADLADLERQAAETKQVINRLCTRAGIEPLYPDASASSTATPGSLRSDSFYGKAITTAVREYLEMRRSAGLGPASPREIYEALDKGGYTFETKDATNALISLRSTIRKNSSIFHRLPNGVYGLLSWYPNAKSQRQDDDDDEPVRTTRGRARKAGKRAIAKPKQKQSATIDKPSESKVVKPASEGGETKKEKIRTELTALLANGVSKTRVEILEHLKSAGIMGHEHNPAANLAAYLSHWKDLVKSQGDGKWALVPKTDEPPSGTPRSGSETVEG